MAADTQNCLRHYGDPTSKTFEAKWMQLYVFPDWLAKIFPPYAGKPVTRQWVNKAIIPAFEAVFRDLLATGLWRELKSFDGLWVVRQKRGISEYSIHSWGLAIDFNASLNPLGVKWGSRKGMFSKAFLDTWRRHGWVCGADFARGDSMHFQFTNSFPTL
jgi:hypothetical protein